MKRIYLNLKRFDVLPEFGGINKIGPKEEYASNIVKGIEKMKLSLPITIFFQESNLLPAIYNKDKVKIGCQGVHFEDTKEGKNFGAFTTLRTANAMRSIGVEATLIGHCEERMYLNKLLSLGHAEKHVNEILNEEIKRAIEAGLDVLYCIGEKTEEQDRKYEVLKEQLLIGLKDCDLSKVTIAYEPVWAIGPGKVPPDRAYIQDIAKHIKEVVNCPIVYGGGLKLENAEMIASIPELDGGLIALTRFGKDFGFFLDDFEAILKKYEGGLK